MSYRIKFSSQAEKDYEFIKKSTLAKKAKLILKILQKNPYSPPCEKLKNNLKGAYSKRLNIQHRIVYEVREENKTVVILRMWTHYEKL